MVRHQAGFTAFRTAAPGGAAAEAAWRHGPAGSASSAIAAGIGLALALALLIGPVTAIVAGLFLDDAAEHIEARDYAGEPAGRAMPIGEAIGCRSASSASSSSATSLAFALLLVPGVNLLAFFLVNGYLLGREFFEFAARRFGRRTRCASLRRKHSGTIFRRGPGHRRLPGGADRQPPDAAVRRGMMVHLHKVISAATANSRMPRRRAA